MQGFEKGIEQGIEKGIEKGRALALHQLLERRLSRPLSEAEQATLARRFEALGADRLSDVALEFSAAAVADWSKDPNTR